MVGLAAHRGPDGPGAVREAEDAKQRGGVEARERLVLFVVVGGDGGRGRRAAARDKCASLSGDAHMEVAARRGEVVLARAGGGEEAFQRGLGVGTRLKVANGDLAPVVFLQLPGEFAGNRQRAQADLGRPQPLVAGKREAHGVGGVKGAPAEFAGESGVESGAGKGDVVVFLDHGIQWD